MTQHENPFQGTYNNFGPVGENAVKTGWTLGGAVVLFHAELAVVTALQDVTPEETTCLFWIFNPTTGRTIKEVLIDFAPYQPYPGNGQMVQLDEETVGFAFEVIHGIGDDAGLLIGKMKLDGTYELANGDGGFVEFENSSINFQDSGNTYYDKNTQIMEVMYWTQTWQPMPPPHPGYHYDSWRQSINFKTLTISTHIIGLTRIENGGYQSFTSYYGSMPLPSDVLAGAVFARGGPWPITYRPPEIFFLDEWEPITEIRGNDNKTYHTWPRDETGNYNDTDFFFMQVDDDSGDIILLGAIFDPKMPDPGRGFPRDPGYWVGYAQRYQLRPFQPAGPLVRLNRYYPEWPDRFGGDQDTWTYEETIMAEPWFENNMFKNDWRIGVGWAENGARLPVPGYSPNEVPVAFQSLKDGRISVARWDIPAPVDFSREIPNYPVYGQGSFPLSTLGGSIAASSKGYLTLLCTSFVVRTADFERHTYSICRLFVTGDVPVRLNQRDDGIGISRTPRITGPEARNGATSAQLSSAPRIGTSNTYH